MEHGIKVVVIRKINRFAALEPGVYFKENS